MCGINGIVSFKSETTLADSIQTMNEKILHRGPDEDGVYLYKDMVAMGMRRLSIIDLKSGSQPMYSDDKSIALVFNGEIYNFLDLKYDLVKQGVSFQTTSDTEVILRLYQSEGIDMLSRLNGMFGLSIHDTRKNKVIIARDRMGEKPIYYTSSEGRFMWASELKSLVSIDTGLKEELSKEAISCYFSLGYIPAPYSIYARVQKLKPAHYIEFDLISKSLNTHRYWEIVNTTIDYSYEIARAKLQSMLSESVQKRMISDVPLGVFLSGGVDSSVVASLMSKHSKTPIKTFSIGFDNPQYDESPQARLLSKHIGSDHTELILSSTDLLDSVGEVLDNFDEPFADSSSIPTYFVSKMAREKVKVALTGDGGDEVFAGYNKYMVHTRGSIFAKYVPTFMINTALWLLNTPLFKPKSTKSFIRKLIRFLEASDKKWSNRHFNIIKLMLTDKEKEVLLTGEYPAIEKLYDDCVKKIEKKGVNLISAARLLDNEISLDGDILVKVDRTSMLNSLECRAPLLDHDIVEFAHSLPESFLVKGKKKRVLKETFEEMVPKGFFEAPKSGFEIPISTWLREEFRPELEKYLSKENLEKSNLFNVSKVREMVNSHLTGSADHSWKLWAFYTFQRWYLSKING